MENAFYIQLDSSDLVCYVTYMKDPILYTTHIAMTSTAAEVVFRFSSPIGEDANPEDAAGVALAMSPATFQQFKEMITANPEKSNEDTSKS